VVRGGVPAAGGQRVLGGGTPNAAAIFPAFRKKNPFLDIEKT